MPEKFPKPQSVEDAELFWGWDTATGQDTPSAVGLPPDAVRKTSGWSRSAPDPIPATWVNWLLQQITRAVVWLSAGHERHFDSLRAALLATPALVDGDLFVVDRAAPVALGAPTITQGAAGATTIEAASCNGARLFYSQGATIYGVDPADPAATIDTQATPEGQVVEYLEATGSFLLVLYGGSFAGSEVHFLDEDDLTVDLRPAISRTMPSVAEPVGASNGSLVAFSTGANGRSFEIYDPFGISTIAVPLWGDGTTGEITDMAMGRERLYVVGVADNVGDQLAAYDAATGTKLWSTPTIGTGEPAGVVTDGELVYVCGGSGVGSTNIWAYTRFGTLVWSAGRNSDAVDVAVDDRYVFVVDVDDNLDVYDKRLGALVDTDDNAGSAQYTLCTDGFGLYGARTDSLHVYNRPGASRRYERAGLYLERKPFYQRATPAE